MEEFDRKLNLEQRCPLCGEDNRCALAASPPGQDCWCASVEIDPDLLAALPPSSRGRACLCKNCCSKKGATLER